MARTLARCGNMWAIALALVLGGGSPWAAAQETPATAAEVALRREIATLRDRLAKAEERIRQLEGERGRLLEELAKLRQAPAAGGGESAGSPGEATAAVPADPFASPASMLEELRRRYEGRFAGVAHDTEPAIRAYREDVRAWCESGVRDLRDRRQWVVRVLEMKESADDKRYVDARLRVIDEASGLAIGGAFNVRLSAADARLIERGKDRFPLWRATVVVGGAPVFNEQRVDAGVFEHPAFVGRYCDFGIEIDVRHLAGMREEDLKRAPAGGTPGR